MKTESILPPAGETQEPVYLGICRRIREQLDSEEFPAGTFLPTERALAERAGVSLRTLRQALAILQQEGRISRRQGRGTMVNAAPVVRAGEPPTVAVALTPSGLGDSAPDWNYRQFVFERLCIELNRCGLGVQVVSMPLYQNPPLPRVLPGRENYLKELIDRQRVHGLIGFPRSFNLCPDLATHGNLPVVMMETNEGFPHADSVGINNAAGVMAAVAELLRLGHRHIGYVGGLSRPADDMPYTLCHDSPERFAAYRRALQEGGVEFQQDWYREVGFDEVEIEALVGRWLERGDLPTAIVVFDDVLVKNLLPALHRAGVVVPRDLSVVGFGNLTPEAQSGRLATVAVDFVEMARLAAQRMQERIANGNGMNGLLLRAGCEFKPGASIARPRRAKVEKAGLRMTKAPVAAN